MYLKTKNYRFYKNKLVFVYLYYQKKTHEWVLVVAGLICPVWH